MLLLYSGYEAYTGYYADGTAYSYDPNTYAAPVASTAPSGAADTATAADSGALFVGPAEQSAAGQTAPAELAVSQSQNAAEIYGMEPIVGLLTSDEKAHLEQQQEEASAARKEAEERLREAEEKRANAKVSNVWSACSKASFSVERVYELSLQMHTM